MPAKSTIPPKAQIPVAIVLSILFVFLLVKRFGGNHAPVPLPPTAVATAAAAVTTKPTTSGVAVADAVTSQSIQTSIAQLQSLLAQVEQNNMQNITRVATQTALKLDPFVRPTPAAVAAANGLVEVGNESTTASTTAGLLLPAGSGAGLPPIPDVAAAGPSRVDRLSQLTLSAVMVAGSTSLSVINKRDVHIGESIGGFILLGVDERGVTLRDDLGTTRLLIHEHNLLASAPEQP